MAVPRSLNEGDVFVMGSGDFGQLGLGPDVMEKSRPAQVPLNYEIIDVCAGGMHTVCLTKEGKVLFFLAIVSVRREQLCFSVRY